MERAKTTLWIVFVLYSFVGVLGVNISDQDAASLSFSTSSTTRIPCSFDIGNLRYNICPLIQSETSYLRLTTVEDTPPTLTRKTYEIGITGPLKMDGTLPRELQCPGGTWICLTVMNTRPNHPSEPSRILQVVPVAGSSNNVHEEETGDLTPKFKVIRDEATSETTLRMTLHGGMYTGQKQKASFLLRCDQSREAAERKHGKVAVPKFSWSFNGTHTFEWRSVHACPERISSNPPDTTGDDTDSDEDNTLPPTDPDPGAIGDSRSSLPHGAGTAYLFLWLPLLSLLLYIIAKRLKALPLMKTWSLAQRKHWLDSSYKSVGGQTESDIGGMTERGEFVGFYGELDEEIPLTPSPRRQTFGYGALK